MFVIEWHTILEKNRTMQTDVRWAEAVPLDPLFVYVSD